MMKRDILNYLRGFPEYPTRQRWILAGAGAFSALGVIAALATPVASLPPEGLKQVTEQLQIATNALISLDNEVFLREERIVRGDTFDRLLSRLGVYDDEARRYILSSPELGKLHRQLVPGRVVSARTTETGKLVSLYFPMNGGESAMIVERRQGKLTAAEQPYQLETRQIIKSGEIRYSFFGATDSIGIPDAIAVQMTEIFSGDIDFHRDLRKGDQFTLVYEVAYNQGRPTQSGRILSAEFVNNGRTYQAFYYEQDGKGSYYDIEGKPLKKAFLRSPLEFSRITSGFSMRFHPILKTWRAHKGIDYGAPTGTKVRATGDGVAQFVGKQNGYGNFILISHAGGYQTAYAHLNAFAAGLKKGNRVSQGEVIGYVGSTGWATGPHLHYEFRVKGSAVNPLDIAAAPAASPLSQAQQIRFRIHSQQQSAKLQMLKDIPVAQFE
jgi:murein DD-endopeptidase MepM/ murein hydrolase activator NlpD